MAFSLGHVDKIMKDLFFSMSKPKESKGLCGGPRSGPKVKPTHVDNIKLEK